MIEAWVIGLRAVQYVAAALLFGLPAFLMYSARATGPLPLAWPRPALFWAALVLALAAPAALVAQTAMMAGSLSEAMKPGSLGMMVTGMGLGMALAVRSATALLAVAAIAMIRPGPRLWWVCASLGLLVSASFAWTGHGAATEGSGHGIHLASDILHALSASLWVGALAAFAALVVWRPKEPSAQDLALARALAGFAGVGTAAVAALLLTGVVNSAFLVGWSGLWTLTDTAYGRWLILKIVLFGLMLSLAAVNRFRLTPAFEAAGADSSPVLGHLRRSLVVEFALSLAVLTIVAVMGALAPPASLP
ncbi:copper homeostasis membrane protein CopD [Brevundimonas sp. AJA228-03]|uniref:copper homeostasis membrane protein CopD n=1 Tax=Brevundimonas sp. AJA228-03 TaxID=2752515 RepID=UPI001ADF4C2E|nr:copper homeostasis membrane protein CopD [Brevundimonas sp. AJA228-03]QTN18166.1 copper homeostasis membrane protein CopD [Brevundimonas sp. AJA228-03]